MLMRTFHANKQDWQPEARHQHPIAQKQVIDEPCVLRDQETNALIAAQFQIPKEQFELAKAIEMSIKFKTDVPMDSARLSGITSRNRVFGTVEPNKLRRRPACAPSRLDIEQPELSRALAHLAQIGCEMWREIDQDTFNVHKRIIEKKVHSDWLIGKTPFTSGVINFTAGLPYHKDSGNLDGSWSLMVALRKNIEGGNLHLPEYNTTLSVFDRSFIVFNGQSLWHGVTPFHIAKRNAHRFTIVYYAKAKIEQCGCKTDELKRVQKAVAE